MSRKVSFTGGAGFIGDRIASHPALKPENVTRNWRSEPELRINHLR